MGRLGASLKTFGSRPGVPETPAPVAGEGLEGRPLPDHSLWRDGRLVAYLWRSDGGVLARARAGSEPLGELSWGDVLCFAAGPDLALVQSVAAGAQSYDAFVFRLGMEGFEIQEGQAQPHDRLRRF